MLKWSSFVVAANEKIDMLAKEFGKQMGVEVVVEKISLNDLQARFAASIQSGTGPDVIQEWNNWAHLYEEGLEDVGDLAEDIQKILPKFNKQLTAYVVVNDVWRAIPFAYVAQTFVYRTDWFAEAGAEKFPTTFDELRTVGKKLKANGHPIGQSLGHSIGDPINFCYPMLWNHGGMEIGDDQKSVVINSKETAAALDFLREFWNAACDPGGLAWDDSSNNRAFFAETIGATLNGASIYFVARRNPEKAPPGLADNINHFLNPKGPAGRFHSILTFTNCITKYSKNKDACKDWIRYQMDDKRYEAYMVENAGYINGPTPKWDNIPMWEADPAVTLYKEMGRYGRNMGFAGPYDRKASEVQAKYIIIDIFAKAAKGESTKSVIAWAEKELKNVYKR